MRKTTPWLIPAAFALLTLALAGGSVSAAGAARRQRPVEPPPAGIAVSAPTVAPSGPIAWFVELEGTPAAVAWADALAVSEEPGETVTTGAISRAQAAAQMQLDLNEAAQAVVATQVRELGVRELYRVSRALNGIAVLATSEQAAALMKAPGVRSVRPIEPEVPHNAASVPYIGVPPLWASTSPVPAGLKGQGIKIGIIDTGIDYMHAGFGGTGLLADYQQAATDSAAWTTSPRGGPGRFPTGKVAGGWDFAGDAYGTTSSVPSPDPNPMDCNGHGSHVAGTAAGFGVTTTGATYTGAYNPTDPYAVALRIGPGSAPEASLYALRVFGCGGSTSLTAAAIDWAIDPNGDGDFTDRLDVINMSLGSSYGGPNDQSAAAADNAARAGVIVVASAGNSGDAYFASGSPGSGGRVIAVANVSDPSAGALLRVNTPAAIATDYAAGTASFGPTAYASPINGNVALVNDGSGTPTFGCNPLVGFPAGSVALIDRGTCSFIIKTANAQAAGAIGVIIANNAAGDPPGLGGTDPAITIPTISVTQATGTLLKSTLAGLGAGEFLNVSFVPAGSGISSTSSRGPRAAVPIRLKPDLAAPGVNIPSVQTGRTCTTADCIVPDASGYLPGSPALTISGTSMAAPHVAGMMALLRQAHPDWSVEHLKALAMNYSLRDITKLGGGLGPKVGPGRIGAGLVGATESLNGEIVAFSLDERGLVTVNFDGEIAGTVRRTRTVAVVNHGASPAVLNLDLAAQVDAPGVAFSLPQTSVAVPAGGYNTFQVVMEADASLMQFSADPSVAASSGRSRLPEEAAYVNFTLVPPAGPVIANGSGPAMRLPVYAALRPIGAGTTEGPLLTGGAATGTGSLTLAGTGLCTGSVDAGVCLGSYPPDRASIASAFEMQGVSPKDPDLHAIGWGHADLRFAGVQYDSGSGLIVFGISTWAPWATPAQVVFNVLIDANNDGVFSSTEKVLLNPRFTGGDLFYSGTATNVSPYSVTASQYVNGINPSILDTGLYGAHALAMMATPAALGVTPGQPFQWKVVSCPGFNYACGMGTAPAPIDEMGPFTWNTTGQGLNFDGWWGYDDQPGNTIPVAWDTANFATNTTKGALILHHLNGGGTQVDQVLVQTDATNPPQSADFAVTIATPLGVVQRGATSTVTVTVTNLGNTDDTLALHLPLPEALSHVSDNGGPTPTASPVARPTAVPPAYDPTSGVWQVGTLAVGQSKSLTVTFQGRTSGTWPLLGEVAASQLPDPNLGNNRAAAWISVREEGEIAAGGFFTVTPCRLVDTRQASGPYGGPALAAGVEKVVAVAGQCGVPATAKAVAINISAAEATGPGFLRAYASFPAQVPNASTLNFAAGTTRANNAIVSLSAAGQMTLQNGMASGSVHAIVDVVGYFE